MRFSRPLGLAMLAPLVLAPSTAQSSRDSGFDAERAWLHLETLVGLGARPSGSKANESARNYIELSLKEAGLDPIRETFSAPTPSGHVTFTNIYADFPATTTNETGAAPMVVLCTHFDTKRLEIDFVGANDGASGVALPLELARVLGRQPRAFTVELLFFDGEEAFGPDITRADGLYGSRFLAASAAADGTLAEVRALIVVDMLADRDLNLATDSGSAPWLRALAREVSGFPLQGRAIAKATKQQLVDLLVQHQ